MNSGCVITFLVSIFCFVTGIKYRLPTTIKPSFYIIKFHPNLDQEIFSGDVSIHLKVESFSESIAFHSSNLTITSLYLNNEKVYNISSCKNCTLFYTFSEHELIEIKRKDENKVSPGNYMVHVKYTGNFSKTDTGFTKAAFTENNNTMSYVAVTDFEPSEARRTFPCFDEPAFKAKFQLTIVVPNNTYIAVSNTKAIRSFNTSYGFVYKFETTPPMSTYLLAFAITQYDYGEMKENGEVPIRVYSYKADDKSSRQVIEYVRQSLKFYTSYTSFPYPISKLDLIEYDRATSTATENWGLITCRTGILLNKTDSFSSYQKVNIISHELAHFWFGNLVTNDWWDDLWLQEGFAVFMALKAEEFILNDNATKWFPFHVMEESIYWFDQKQQSKPIINFGEKPSDIIENFSDITYSKGAAVLSMIEKILGPKTFQQAVRCYISKYAYKTASTSDFLNIIEDFKPKNTDIRGFLETYIYQNRYPIVYVTEKENHYVLTQFSCTKDNNEKSPYGYKWTIPLTYVTNQDQNNESLVWFDKDMDTLQIPKVNESWIKFNHDEVGIYRMNYSESMWNKFIVHAKEMGNKYQGHLFLEAVQLFDGDIASCSVGIKYFMELSKLNKNRIPIGHSHIFVAYQKLKKIQKYDKHAFKCLSNFFANILKESGDKRMARNLSKGAYDNFTDDNEVSDTKKKNEEPQSEQMRSCILWIKDNLNDYCEMNFN